MNTNTKHIIIGLVLLATLIVAMAVFKGTEVSSPAPVADAPMGKLPAGSVPPPATADVVGTTWVWTETVKSDGNMIMPKKADAFTINLNANGKLTGTTDCNGFGGDYQIGSDGVITFGPFVSTLMYCEGSQESTFTGDMANVSRMMIDQSGDLVLMLKYDSGSMIFRRK